jgi:alpha-tubulin suppressor-like RCC1 family protein
VPCAEYAHSRSNTLASALAALRTQAPPTGNIAPLAARPTKGGTVGTRDVYFGQQGVDVYVGVTNVALNGTMFQFDATIQNLATEPLGTADGRTPASDSVMIFFTQLPVVTAGTGSVTVANPTGYNTFTASNQPYYQYPGLLPSNATSPPMLWEMTVSTGVQAFDFDVYVAAQVPDTSAAALAIPAHAFDSLAVGEAHTCAIRAGNHEYCWGFNAYGALGVQESSPVTIPEGVLGNLGIESVAAGSEFSCALAVGGAYCWGDNLSGEVGDGTEIDRGEPVVTSPPVGQFAVIKAGTEFSCGLVSGAAYCWGDNYTGQLGNASTTPDARPTAVAGSLQFAALTVGAFHACALTSGGSAYCWGANADGELGTGNTTTATSPAAVNTSTLFASIAAGNDFTCALDGAGNAYCWGANTFGALGIGTVGGTASTPQTVTGGLHFTRIAAGAFHVCGITTSGATYCWGSNSSGQVGDGTTTDHSAPEAVSGAYAFTAIGAGFAHSCGLTGSGSTYCWGDNSSGQIGDGTFTQRLSPTSVLLP